MSELPLEETILKYLFKSNNFSVLNLASLMISFNDLWTKPFEHIVKVGKVIEFLLMISNCGIFS